MNGERLIDFGPLPEAVDALLQAGVRAHRTDKAAAEALFRAALAEAPDALPVHLCLYKIHAYAGDGDAALEAVEAALREAARQANLPADWLKWPPFPGPCPTTDGPERFALYSLKALAFIRLKRGEPEAARAALDALARLDPHDQVGARVVAALADGVAEGVA